MSGFQESFRDYTAFPRDQYMPDCPTCCVNGNVAIIGSQLDDSLEGGIAEIWHCGTCNQSFGGKTYDAKNLLSRNGVYANAASCTPVEGTIQSCSTFEHELERWLDEQQGPERVATDIRICALEQKIRDLEQKLADPIAALREEVARFTLR